MKKLKIYLDTSIINFALADDVSREAVDVTRKLCEGIKQGKYDGFISEVVIREIMNTSSATRRKQLLEYVNQLEFEEPLEVTDEITSLADKYISEKIIPEAHKDDALHVAIATVNSMDILASWNFEHLVKHKTRTGVFGINALLGYKNIDLCTPKEVVEDE